MRERDEVESEIDSAEKAVRLGIRAPVMVGMSVGLGAIVDPAVKVADAEEAAGRPLRVAFHFGTHVMSAIREMSGQIELAAFLGRSQRRTLAKEHRGRWVVEASARRVFGEFCEMAAPLFLAQCQVWNARFLVGPGSLSLPIGLDAARTLLGDRDLDEGATRRAALVHLVRAHGRITPSGGVAEVTEHLRGRRECTWRGWQVTLVQPRVTTPAVPRGDAGEPT